MKWCMQPARVELVANKIGIGFDPCIYYITTSTVLTASYLDLTKNIQHLSAYEGRVIDHVKNRAFNVLLLSDKS